MIKAEILADSISESGHRLTTFRVRFPKSLLAEFNTHRSLSRNWASSRAIPARRVRSQIIRDPFVPTYFGANQAGMQAAAELSGFRLFLAKRLWLWARYPAIVFHWALEKVGLHKQHANRILEPWMWADGIVSATEWQNFFQLRCHPDAQPEFRRLAEEMRELMKFCTPRPVKAGDWHLPLVEPGHHIDSTLLKISAARCARVSYSRASSTEINRDITLYDRLCGSVPMHLSPLEHQATPVDGRHGNFCGWRQHRKDLILESGGDYR
jgi:hypothetical protein